MGFEEKFEY